MDTMKVVVIDSSNSGHREMYYKQFARTWKAMGCKTTLLAPAGIEIDDTNIVVRPLALAQLRRLPSNKPLKKRLTILYNAYVRLRNLPRLWRNIKMEHPDFVFFAYLDDILPTIAPLWLFNKLFPFHWGGLLIYSDLPSYKWFVPDVRPFLRSKYCVGVGVLNEYIVERLQVWQPRTMLFPDFTDTTPPGTSYPLVQELIRKANGRKVVSILGSIDSRKGIELLCRSIDMLSEESYFFLIAGKSALVAQQEEDLRAVEQRHENCLFVLERIPDEACFNALVANSDLIFAAYQHFTGSSNLLTKAAYFHKPVLVSQGYCMGKRVEKLRTGAVIPENNVEACVSAIQNLCFSPGIDAASFDGYYSHHTVEKLTDCLRRFLPPPAGGGGGSRNVSYR
ncbi:MAG: glycosyltransferase [Mediterranea sp.]|jgi:hypothetical protein|nr:glycosyltransferase [Mediterranea sp.]